MLQTKAVFAFPKPEWHTLSTNVFHVAVLDPIRQAFQNSDLLTNTEGGDAELNLG